jgi:NAD(P)-dependent dehydrogenase (short-subunit alcohol dehydrogenase family)
MRKIKDLVNLRGRVAMISGGAGHIGAAAASALAELGADIVLLDIDESSVSTAAESIAKEEGVRVLPLVVDLRSECEIRSVPELVKTKFGRLDILVNSAALVGTSTREGWTTSFSQQKMGPWEEALEVNLTGVFLLIQAVKDLLTASPSGSVINLSSIYGLVGPDLRLYSETEMGNPAAYAASKGGLIQLTRWLATVLAPGIRVNSISPGGVFRNQPEVFCERYIERTPLNRMATEEDIKGAVAYLASDMASYVTGHNLVVDGGWTAW